jgi:hypothetical protein
LGTKFSGSEKESTMRNVCLRVLSGSILVLASLSASVSDAASFATQVVSYTAGSNVPAGYDDPTSSLGSPTRSTGDGPFDGDVTPFNAPYLPDQVVAIGAGGQLTVRFDEIVTDDPSNLYGIDLLIYGNAFLGIDFGSGLADGVIFGEPARVSVSQDGVTWVDADGIFADALFPTLAYQDPTGPFSSGGTIPTNFHRPVDPSLTAADFAGLDIAQIAALYNGGGGGVGLDLADLGLEWIEYVRVWQPEGDGFAAEIDGFATVPEPGSLTLLGVGALALTWIRARTPRPSRPAADRA